MESYSLEDILHLRFLNESPGETPQENSLDESHKVLNIKGRLQYLDNVLDVAIKWIDGIDQEGMCNRYNHDFFSQTEQVRATLRESKIKLNKLVEIIQKDKYKKL